MYLINGYSNSVNTALTYDETAMHYSEQRMVRCAAACLNELAKLLSLRENTASVWCDVCVHSNINMCMVFAFRNFLFCFCAQIYTYGSLVKTLQAVAALTPNETVYWVDKAKGQVDELAFLELNLFYAENYGYNSEVYLGGEHVRDLQSGGMACIAY